MSLLVVAGAAYGEMKDKGFADGAVAKDGAIRLPENFRTD